MAENNSDFPIDDELGGMLDTLQSPLDNAEQEFIDAAFEVLAFAKDNAPWADRTGLARAGLEIEVFTEGEQVYMELYHTVDYGVFLETIQDGQYATIMPTLELFAGPIFDALGAQMIGGEGGDV